MYSSGNGWTSRMEESDAPAAESGQGEWNF
jgi:hypothetical protein